MHTVVAYIKARRLWPEEEREKRIGLRVRTTATALLRLAAAARERARVLELACVGRAGVIRREMQAGCALPGCPGSCRQCATPVVVEPRPIRLEWFAREPLWGRPPLWECAALPRGMRAVSLDRHVCRCSYSIENDTSPFTIWKGILACTQNDETHRSHLGSQ